MNSDCLVLNAAWIPIETVTWQDAFTKIFNGRAEPIEYYEESVKTPTDEYLKPAVIRCIEYTGVPKRAHVYSKRQVLIRDSYTCQYCGAQITSDEATIDHVVPRSKGGRSTFENTVCACGSCNKRKADKSLKEAKMKLLREPVKPRTNAIRAKFGRMEIPPTWKHHLEPHLNGK